MKNFTLQEFEKLVQIRVNQVIFINALGEWEYHPEREDFLDRYIYAKYILKYEFKQDFELDTDIFSLAFFDEVEKELDEVIKTEDFECNSDYEFDALRSAAYNKIEYLKKLSLQRSNYSISDVYLGSLLEKLNSWIEDNGIVKAMEVLAQAGDQLIEKESENNGNKNIRRTKQKAK